MVANNFKTKNLSFNIVWLIENIIVYYYLKENIF